MRKLYILWLALATVPIALDGFTQLFGWRTSTNFLRLATGALFGLAVAAWLVPFTARASDKMRKLISKLKGVSRVKTKQYLVVLRP